MELSDKEWLIEQGDFEISAHMETCFTLANGYMGVRGTYEENYSEEIPGTYLAGIFDKSAAQVSELVNFPYFFELKFYIDGEYIDPRKCEILDFKRALDMKNGLLYKLISIRDGKGRVSKIEGYRFLSIANRHFAGMEYQFTAVNYKGFIVVESITDGTVLNSKKDPKEKVKHFKVLENKPLTSQGMYMEVATFDKDYRVGIASSLRLEKDGKNAVINRRKVSCGEILMENVEVEVEEGTVFAVKKYITVVSSREYINNQLEREASQLLLKFEAQGMGSALKESIFKYKQLWDVMNIEIDGDHEAETAIRFNIFHLMNCANPDDQRVSIGAKGLHGEGYKGHVFWDTEIFMIPFFIYSEPRAARSLLMYRYHTLGAARGNAKQNGYKGARYAWESADTGQEETPRWGLDYKGNPVRIWTGDIEYHISADVAYAMWEYYRASGDEEFFLDYGIEVILETARFWSTLAKYNTELDRYEINDVIGPDEFHEHIDNNIYTNYLAKWNIEKGLHLLDWLNENYSDHYNRIVSEISITEKELKKLKKVAKKLYISFNPEKGLMEQFEGYFKLKDVFIDEYDDNNMPIWPKEVDITDLNTYTLIKQADVIMLLHLLGEDFNFSTKKKNFKYYEKRTMQKSSLSPSIYSLMGLVVGDHSKAYEYLMRTAKVDLADNQGNTAHGLHSASTGGTWQAAVFGFGGMYVNKEGVLGFAPKWIPEHWDSFTFRIHWQSTILKVTVKRNNITVEMVKGDKEIPIEIHQKEYTVSKNCIVEENIGYYPTK